MSHAPSCHAVTGRSAVATGAVRLALAAALALPGSLASLAVTSPLNAATAAATADVALRVLVLDDGGPTVGAISDRLDVEGVPYSRIDLTSSTRPRLTAASLATTDATGVHARYAGVVTPNESPSQLSADERSLLETYERTFKVREVNAFDWSYPGVGLQDSQWDGVLDGMTAKVTTAGLTGPFAYLKGPLPIEDYDSSYGESWGSLAPAAPQSVSGGTFTPLITVTIPGTTTQGSLVGVFTKNTREQLVITLGHNSTMRHWRTIGHGVISWLTRGLSLSMNRNYFSVHVDDVLLSDNRWVAKDNCTVGSDCPAGVTAPLIRMTPADVTRLTTWQDANQFKLVMAFNGAATAQNADPVTGKDALTQSLLASKAKLAWINHTWSHLFLGCRQNFTTTPWSCVQGADGSTTWRTESEISTEITKNKQYASSNGLPGFNGTELVTGEHSGLAKPPQMPADNPNLKAALTRTNTAWVASNTPLEKDPRVIGSATTVPRYPIDVFYNTGTKAEAVDQYNWWSTSRADGGSGMCEANGTCVAPLDPATGFDTTIAPAEVTLETAHLLHNDARPHYAHQSNLAEDGVLYGILGSVLSRYSATFAANTPVVNPTMRAAGAQLVSQQGWQTNRDLVRATVSGTRVSVTNPSSAAVDVPVTAPNGTRVLLTGGTTGAVLGAAYAGERSGWVSMPAASTTSYLLTKASGFATTALWPAP